LRTQLHEVPIIRKEGHAVFKDLKHRIIRWKQINLYKIMKEVKEELRRSISEKRMLNEITSLKALENFINEFLHLEYDKRKLKYDVNISFSEGVQILISNEKLDLGKNMVNINQYFKDIMK
jgi:hypothetical protein